MSRRKLNLVPCFLCKKRLPEKRMMKGVRFGRVRCASGDVNSPRGHFHDEEQVDM